MRRRRQHFLLWCTSCGDGWARGQRGGDGRGGGVARGVGRGDDGTSDRAARASSTVRHEEAASNEPAVVLKSGLVPATVEW